MRFIFLIFLLSVLSAVLAWEKEDYQLFELQAALQAEEGPDATLYTWLELPDGPKSSFDQINKAYRRKSRQLHPDKVKLPAGLTEKQRRKARKQATERFSRLSLAGDILRGHQKERYDFFLAHGFPKWTERGYIYSKYRPGLIGVLLGLYFFVFGVAHYGVLVLNRRSEKRKLENFILSVREAAWKSSNGAPPAGVTSRIMRLNSGAGERDFRVDFDGSVYLKEYLNQEKGGDRAEAETEAGDSGEDDSGAGVGTGMDAREKLKKRQQKAAAERKRKQSKKRQAKQAGDRSSDNAVYHLLNPDDLPDARVADTLFVRSITAVGRAISSVFRRSSVEMEKPVVKRDGDAILVDSKVIKPRQKRQ